MIKGFDPMATAMSAIANASRIPVTPDQVRAMLATGIGEPTHLRALFGDVGLTTLMRIAVAADIPTQSVIDAYRRAGAVGAAHAGLDDLIAADRGNGRR